MPIAAYLAALGGAAAGALGWALLSWGTGYEVGYVAWGVGGVVGFAAARFGANGKYSGAVCAALTLLAIFSGKVAAVHLALPGQIEKEIRSQSTMMHIVYDTLKADGEAFSRISSEDEQTAFMVEHGYAVETMDPAGITPEELAAFRRDTIPDLQEFASGTPSYDDWIRRQTERVVRDSKSEILGLIVKNLGPIDFLFAFLGVGTAWRLGRASLQGAGAVPTSRPLHTNPPPAPVTPTPPPAGGAPTHP